ncbi:hypothetical protein LSO10F_30003 [Candidatus Liberibacter solanacearum]
MTTRDLGSSGVMISIDPVCIVSDKSQIVPLIATAIAFFAIDLDIDSATSYPVVWAGKFLIKPSGNVKVIFEGIGDIPFLLFDLSMDCF